MTLELGPDHLLLYHTPIETFLTTLANCPDLELLKLVRIGPSSPNGHRDDCDVVVQLHRLRELCLNFDHASTIGCILSHIRYPESARLEAGVLMGNHSNMCEAISQILPHDNPGVLSQFQKARELAVGLYRCSSTFSTDKATIRRWHWTPEYSPQVACRVIQKVLEVVEKDVVVLSIVAQNFNLSGAWESILHELPRLEQIRWWFFGERKNPGVADPFIYAFSLPFEGGLVCPRLTHLELSREVVLQDQSATLLKRTLTERNACGLRLKWMGLIDEITGLKIYDTPMLEQFRDLVDEVR